MLKFKRKFRRQRVNYSRDSVEILLVLFSWSHFRHFPTTVFTSILLFATSARLWSNLCIRHRALFLRNWEERRHKGVDFTPSRPLYTLITLYVQTPLCLSILHACQHSFQNLLFRAGMLKSGNDLKTVSAKREYENGSLLKAHKEAPTEKNVT